MTFRGAPREGPLGLGICIWSTTSGVSGPVGNFIITESSNLIITESGNNWVIE